MPHASHLEAKAKSCPWCNCRAAQVWFWCGLSTLWHDTRTDELARSRRKHAQPFLLSRCCSENNQACLPGTLCNSGQKGVMHSMQAARWARTQNCSRSPNLAPNSTVSKPPPSTIRADPQEKLKWSLPLVLPP